MQASSLCALGQSVAVPLFTIMDHYADEIEAHLEGGVALRAYAGQILQTQTSRHTRRSRRATGSGERRLDGGEMSDITLTIDGKSVCASPEMTILEAARTVGIKIPTLCWHEDLGSPSVCRVCVVEIEGQNTLQPACSYPVSQGMTVRTNTPRVRNARRMAIELLLAHHPDDCLSCQRNLKCELQQLAADFGIREIRFERVSRKIPRDESTPSLVRDADKCINCRRCIEACEKIQGVAVLSTVNRGFDSVVLPAFGDDLDSVVCVLCGQCTLACPTGGAIVERDDTGKVWDALADPNMHVVVQTAPAIRASLGGGTRTACWLYSHWQAGGCPQEDRF